jgi:hypothetical protein
MTGLPGLDRVFAVAFPDMTSAADHRRRLGLGLALGAVIAAAGVGAIVTADEGQADTIAITAEAGDASGEATEESTDEAPAPVADAAAAPVGLALPDPRG